VLYVGFEYDLLSIVVIVLMYEVDDVVVYICVNVFNVGVCGDWIGEGCVDLFVIYFNGDFYFYEGWGNGIVGSVELLFDYFD